MNPYLLISIYIFILLLGLLIGLSKEKILNSIYGIRYKKYVEIDTGRYGDCILSKNLDSVKIHEQVKSVNLKNRIGNILIFSEDIAENLKCEYDNGKALFYMNSNEFDNLYKNKILEQLMYIKEKNLIMIILILSGIGIALNIYNSYILNNMR